MTNISANQESGSSPKTNGKTKTGAELTASSFDSLDGSDAFDVMRAELDALPPAAFINTDVGQVVQTTLGMDKRLAPILGELTVAVPNYDFKANLQRMKTTALALNFIQAKYRILRRSTDTALTDWLTQRRGQFQAFGLVLVRHGIVEEADLDALRHTNNHQALGYDVMGLVEMLLTHFPSVACALLTREQLLEARAKANELFVQLGTRAFGPEATEEVKLLRRKLFALLVQQFSELEAAVAYGRRTQRDVAKWIPPLYAKRTPRKGDEDIDEDDVADDEAPPVNTSASTSTSSDGVDIDQINRTVAEAAANVQGIGIPTTSPFRPTEEK